MYTNVVVISGIKDLVLAAPVPVVFDHFGGTQPALGLEQPGFSDLIALVRAGKAYVKISGVYRASSKAPTAYFEMHRRRSSRVRVRSVSNAGIRYG